MSLRCSLLGHSYGDVQIERDREEQGSEVVVTVREFEECERCGNQNVVSENKEVTALQSQSSDPEPAATEATEDAGGDAGGTTEAGGATEAGRTADAAGVADEAVSAGGDDAEILTDSSDDDGPVESRDTTAEASAGTVDSGASGEPGAEASTAADDFERHQSAADDDGVILDDTDETDGEDDRRPGEWPDAETTHPAETDEDDHTAWPEVGREDEGFDAEPGGGSADVDFGGGLTPESAPEVDDSETDEVEFVNAEGDALRSTDAENNGPELSSGISAGAEAPTLSGPAEGPDVDAEFVCPECGYREGVAGSSLRAGDICPECARGYLAQE